jgi:peptide/nickel transport system substrate-binding protein
VASVEKPRTLDPADGYEVAISDIITSLGDRLYTYKEDTAEVIPQLATALPKISEDGLTYTIPLRQGVVFHDGEVFNAKAMAFSLERFVKNGGKPSTLLSNVMDSVQASGDYELTIKLKAPFAPFPALLAFPGMCAVSPKAYEIGAGKFKPKEFVGTGPYKLASFAPDLVKIDAFDKYWGDKPTLKGIDFTLLGSAANLYNSFTTGATDIAFRDLEAAQVLGLKEEAKVKGWQTLEKPSSGLHYLVLNTKIKPLDQVEVRQAIASVIDRPLIIDRVYKKQADPAYSSIPTNFPASIPAFKAPYGDGNVAKAKELLTKAGFSKTKPFELEIIYSSNSSEREATAILLKEYVAQKLEGIMTVKPQSVESTTLFSNVEKGIYPSYLIAWYPDFGDADNYLTPFFNCDKGSAATGCEEGDSKTQGFFYYNEELLKLLKAQRQERDPAKRKQIIAQAQEIVARDVPFVPLWQKKEFAFAQKNVKNFNLNPILGLPVAKMSKG